jgi:hypothetical protein
MSGCNLFATLHILLRISLLACIGKSNARARVGVSARQLTCMAKSNAVQMHVLDKDACPRESSYLRVQRFGCDETQSSGRVWGRGGF